MRKTAGFAYDAMEFLEPISVSPSAQIPRLGYSLIPDLASDEPNGDRGERNVALVARMSQKRLHSSSFARMMLVARLQCLTCRTNEPKERQNKNELQNQINPWGTHCSSHAVVDLRSSTRRCAAERTTGDVPGYSWGVGDFCFAVRETEVGTLYLR
jgi:hypothetical protein